MITTQGQLAPGITDRALSYSIKTCDFVASPIKKLSLFLHALDLNLAGSSRTT